MRLRGVHGERGRSGEGKRREAKRRGGGAGSGRPLELAGRGAARPAGRDCGGDAVTRVGRFGLSSRARALGFLWCEGCRLEASALPPRRSPAKPHGGGAAWFSLPRRPALAFRVPLPLNKEHAKPGDLGGELRVPQPVLLLPGRAVVRTEP